MFSTLFESRQQLRRSTGGPFVSLLTHAVIITLAVVATERADLLPATRFDPPPIYVRPVPPPQVSRPRHPSGPAPAGAFASVPLIHLSVAPRTDLQPIDVLANQPAVDFGEASGHQTYCGVVCPAAHSADGTDVRTWSGAEVQMQFRQPPTPPRYPERLRSAGVEGSVVVKFVVDTTGRVDPATVEVMSSTHELFTAAVRDALARLRFFPATADNRKIRAAAMMPFQFTLR
jgi:periplasmic protein TonB